MRDVLDLVRNRRLLLGWKGQLANEWLEGLVLVVPMGSKLTAKEGCTMSEIANKRRVEKSVRKDVTASVELEALKGCSIRCTRHDLYCPWLASNSDQKTLTCARNASSCVSCSSSESAFSSSVIAIT